MKKKIRNRLYHLLVLNLKDPTIKSIDGHVVTVAGYAMNVCNLEKCDLDELDIRQWKVFCRGSDSMESNQMIRYCIREGKKR